MSDQLLGRKFAAVIRPADRARFYAVLAACCEAELGVDAGAEAMLAAIDDDDQVRHGAAPRPMREAVDRFLKEKGRLGERLRAVFGPMTTVEEKALFLALDRASATDRGVAAVILSRAAALAVHA